MTTVFNLVIGALIKVISGGLSNWMDFKRQKELAILNTNKDLAVALQSGTDKADWSARATRVILALWLMGVWGYLMFYIVVVRPDIQFSVFIGRTFSGFWSFLTPWPVNDKGIVTISAGSLLWEFKTMIEILIGFYFTKIGK